MGLFYLYTNAKIEIHICSNKHETGLVVAVLCGRENVHLSAEGKSVHL